MFQGRRAFGLTLRTTVSVKELSTTEEEPPVLKGDTRKDVLTAQLCPLKAPEYKDPNLLKEAWVEGAPHSPKVITKKAFPWGQYAEAGAEMGARFYPS